MTSFSGPTSASSRSDRPASGAIQSRMLPISPVIASASPRRSSSAPSSRSLAIASRSRSSPSASKSLASWRRSRAPSPLSSCRSSSIPCRSFRWSCICRSRSWYAVTSAAESSSVVSMLLTVALSVVSVVLVEFSSGMSESELPASASSASSAASVCGSSSPRSAISCRRTVSMPEMPSDSVPRPLCMDCKVFSMPDSPSYRLSPDSPKRFLTSRRSDRISSEDRVAGAMNSSSPMFSK